MAQRDRVGGIRNVIRLDPYDLSRLSGTDNRDIVLWIFDQEKTAVRIQNAFQHALAAAIGLVICSPAAWGSCQGGTNAPNSRYILNGGEAYDTQTNLTWKRCSVGQTWTGSGCAGAIKYLDFEKAKEHAQGRWQVPSRKQLETLVAQGCATIAINENVFPGTPIDPYWSSAARSTNLAWYVRFVPSSTDTYGNRSFTAAVRLVKKGK